MEASVGSNVSDKDFAFMGINRNLLLLSAPNDYDDENDQFNTEALESALEDALLYYAPEATIIIKSMIPLAILNVLTRSID